MIKDFIPKNPGSLYVIGGILILFLFVSSMKRCSKNALKEYEGKIEVLEDSIKKSKKEIKETKKSAKKKEKEVKKAVKKSTKARKKYEATIPTEAELEEIAEDSIAFLNSDMSTKARILSREIYDN